MGILDSIKGKFSGLRGASAPVPGQAAAAGTPAPYSAIDPKITGTRGLSAPVAPPTGVTPPGMTAQDYQIQRILSQKGPIPDLSTPRGMNPRLAAPFTQPPTADLNYQPKMGSTIPNMDPRTGQPLDLAKGLAPKAINNGLGVSSYGSEFSQNPAAFGETPAAGATPTGGGTPTGVRGAYNSAVATAGGGKIANTLKVGGPLLAGALQAKAAYADSQEMNDTTERTALAGENLGRFAGATAGGALGLAAGPGAIVASPLLATAGYFAPDLVKKTTDALGLTDKTTLLPSALAEQRRQARGLAALEPAATAAAAPAAATAPAADPGTMDSTGSVGIDPQADVQTAKDRFDAGTQRMDVFDRFNTADANGLRANKGYVGDDLAARGNAGLDHLANYQGGVKITQDEQGNTIETPVASGMDDFNNLQAARGNGIRGSVDANGRVMLTGNGANATKTPDSGFNLAEQNAKMETALRANNDLPSMQGAGVRTMGGGNVLEQAAARRQQQQATENALKTRGLDIQAQTAGVTKALGVANLMETMRQHNIDNDFKGKEYQRNVGKDKLEQGIKLNTDNREENKAAKERVTELLATTQTDDKGKQTTFTKPEDVQGFASFVRSNPGAYDLNNDASMQHAVNSYQLNKALQSGDRSVLGKLATWAGFQAPQTTTNLTVQPTGLRNTTVGDYLMNKDVSLPDLALGRPKLESSTGHLSNVQDLVKTPEAAAELIRRMTPQQAAALKKHMGI
jgi:hypothetical protein